MSIFPQFSEANDDLIVEGINKMPDLQVKGQDALEKVLTISRPLRTEIFR